MRTRLLAGLFAAGLFAAPACADTLLPVEPVAALTGAMPTGVTVSAKHRIFLNYPQWGDHPPFAVGELKDGKVTAYPDAAINTPDAKRPGETLLSVQSVVVDADDRLWILDTAAPGFSAPVPGGAKLVAVDLSTDRVVKTIPLGPDVVLPSSYVNDVRFDLGRGVAYITDSSLGGPGALIVVDLATGKAQRRLSGHATTMPDAGFVAVVDGEAMLSRPAGGPAKPFLVASDGIELSPDGQTLYYCALSSRRLYSVPTALLRDPAASDADIAAHIADLGEKGASDGLAIDAAGRLYAGDYEHNAIRLYAGGQWTLLAQDPRLLWPDTFSIGRDGFLYVTANQLFRQPGFHAGRDLRRQPYELLRLDIGAGPALVK